MKLDRNTEGNEGRGKYAILKLRTLELFKGSNTFYGLHPELARAIYVLEEAGVLDWGDVGTESEFFLIRLKDMFACDALQAYSLAAKQVDPEYAAEVFELAMRSGAHSPFCKLPD